MKPPVYECKDKGGSYLIVGRATPAGVLNELGELIVYVDTETGRYFVRTRADFDARMQELPQ